MVDRENIRIKWNYGEALEHFQSRMEKICSHRDGMQPYERKMFDEGWMYIEWSSYKPSWKTDFRPRSELSNIICAALGDDDKFVFDEHHGLWKPKDLVPAVKEFAERLNPRMAKFLEKYQGRDLMIDRKSQVSWYLDDHKDWYKHSDISWFLKKV
jgi:hypothetical protein